jgi:hypothetical protein
MWPPHTMFDGTIMFSTAVFDGTIMFSTLDLV